MSEQRFVYVVWQIDYDGMTGLGEDPIRRKVVVVCDAPIDVNEWVTGRSEELEKSGGFYAGGSVSPLVSYTVKERYPQWDVEKVPFIDGPFIRPLTTG